MFTKHYIGGRHIPEQQLVVGRIRHLTKEERKQFMREYEEFRETYCIVLMKRTGKGSDWHISLNPHRMQKLREEFDHGNMG
jgi:hypothetical protein